MPHRPSQHTIADIAINQVEAVLLSKGWAVERIERDYGEDLLVQSTLAGLVDPFKILIQVKGSRAAPRRSIAFDMFHLWRWRNNSELVLLIQWNTVKKSGIFVIPEHIQVNQSNATSATISFPKENVFNEDACSSIAWQARIRHWARAIALAENRMDMSGDSKVMSNEYWRVTYEMGNILGVMQHNESMTAMILSLEAREMMCKIYRNERRDGKNHNKARDMASMLSFMFMYTRKTKIDIDISLLRSGSSLMRALFARDAQLKAMDTLDADQVVEALQAY